VFISKTICKMNWNKVLIGGLLGGVVYFFLGWLVWGILLKDMDSTPDSVALVDNNMHMWAMAVSCILWGMLLAYIFNRWAGIRSMAGGATAGATIALLTSLSHGLSMHATMNFYGVNHVLVDAIATTLVSAITGAVIGWFLGREKIA
jgi:TRAP-type C4-dicarboxylate transport system permease large subunit